MDTLTKSPIERFPIYFNFSTDMIAGETIVSISEFTSINQATGESSFDDRAYDAGPPEVLAIVKVIDSFAIQSPDVQLVLKDGVEGDEHHIQCVAVTSAGNIFQRDLLLRIQSEVTDSFIKQPDDAFAFDMDFTRRLESGDSVASAVVAAVKESDGSDAAALVPGVAVSTPLVAVAVIDGTDGETYRLGVRGTTAAGYVYEKFVRMSVQEF
jgi:hypothetical protein